jgi:hypothetical protein
MDDLRRAEVLVIAIEDVLSELRDRDDPSLGQHIAELEVMQVELVAQLEALSVAPD